MADATTIYDVRVRYLTEDRASSSLTGIARKADAAAKASKDLNMALGAVGVAVAAVGGFGAGKRAFIDFNSEVEQSKIGIAAIANMFAPGQSFETSMTNAQGVFERYQQAAVQSTATTKDFLAMHQMLAPSLAKTAASQAAVEEIVKGATIAAPIMMPGQPDASGMFARDIRSMLEGSVTNRDHAATLMIAAAGLDKETFNKKARENINFALAFIQKSMSSPTLKAAAKTMEGSFAGVTSTLEDTFQILGGKAGEPLFRAITAEIKGWNEWLTNNQILIQDISKRVGESLVDGFRMLKSSVQWIVQNASTLKQVAEVFLAVKGVGLLSGTITSGISGLASGITATVTQGSKTVEKSFSQLASGAFNVVTALSSLYIGADFLADMLLKWAGQDFDKRGDMMAVREGLYNAPTKEAAFNLAHQYAREFGAVDKEGNLNPEVYRRGLGRKGLDPRDQFILTNRALGLFDEFADQSWERMNRREDGEKKQKLKKPSDVKITINKIEVSSDDPDRFMIGLVTAAERAQSNPTQAKSAFHRSI